MRAAKEDAVGHLAHLLDALDHKTGVVLDQAEVGGYQRDPPDHRSSQAGGPQPTGIYL